MIKLDNKNNKIFILKNILKQISKNIYDIEKYDYSKYEIIKEEDYKLIKKIFRTTISKPTNERTFKKLIINMYKNITEIITSKRNKCRKDDRDEILYNYNKEKI